MRANRVCLKDILLLSLTSPNHQTQVEHSITCAGKNGSKARCVIVPDRKERRFDIDDSLASLRQHTKLESRNISGSDLAFEIGL